MRIGIDARFLTHPQPGGFKTYTESLVAALAALDVDNEYFLYVDRVPGPATQLPAQPNVSVRVVPGSYPLLGMIWREQVGLARQVARDRVNLLHSPSLTAPIMPACPSVVTIHDMIWYFPEKFSQGKPVSGKRQLIEWYYRYIPKLSAERATAIITVSYAARQSILEHLRVTAAQVFVTPEAASPFYGVIDDPATIESIRRKYGLPPNYVLAMGSADPRKNLSTLVRAYAALPLALRERHHLAIVWTHQFLADTLAHEIDRLGITSQVIFMQNVSNQDLKLLYNGAVLFVFPSLYEGFGLPPLEAMACGAPVVAANNSSIPEIVGTAVPQFDALDAPAITQAIHSVLADESYRDRLRRYGLERAQTFSWRRCAQETLQVYQRVAQP